MVRRAFSSNISFSDAAMKAKMAGYIIDGQSFNKRTGEYLVFGAPAMFF